MKRFITSFIIIIGIIAASIPASAQLRWGPSAGVSFNTMKFKQDLFDVKTGIGGGAGMRGEMMFPGIGFGIELGLYYQQRAAKLDLGQKLIWSSEGYGNENIYLHSIDIPFNLKFKWTRMQGLEDYVAPFVYGGPILSIQAGHSKCDALKYSGGEVLLTVGGGFEIMKRWQIAASYTWGMTYALKTRLLTDVSARNRTLDIKLTYFLK
ncbi:MAG: PorT family protein [Muribaculaceae bacterium]|nr:PorT family protein [Muribaculaceae bacterium]